MRTKPTMTQWRTKCFDIWRWHGLKFDTISETRIGEKNYTWPIWNVARWQSTSPQRVNTNHRILTNRVCFLLLFDKNNNNNHDADYRVDSIEGKTVDLIEEKLEHINRLSSVIYQRMLFISFVIIRKRNWDDSRKKKKIPAPPFLNR